MYSFDSIPPEFTQIDKPPKQLFGIGDRTLMTSPKVSIVGTRKPINYTKHMTRFIAGSLKERGVVVVSGSAMGVDALAHEGAFPNTIAVMGNSLDIDYPAINRPLIQKMKAESLLLSEYPPTFRPTRYSFVERNRLVVALGQILIITQADKNSGSLRSAEFALAQGKRIFVLPHRLGESEGTWKLLNEGKAEPIADIEKFVSLFGNIRPKGKDPLLQFCMGNPKFEDALQQFGEKIYEYELEGKIFIKNGTVQVSK